jgi:hypothetical protein
MFINDPWEHCKKYTNCNGLFGSLYTFTSGVFRLRYVLSANTFCRRYLTLKNINHFFDMISHFYDRPICIVCRNICLPKHLSAETFVCRNICLPTHFVRRYVLSSDIFCRQYVMSLIRMFFVCQYIWSLICFVADTFWADLFCPDTFCHKYCTFCPDTFCPCTPDTAKSSSTVSLTLLGLQ